MLEESSITLSQLAQPAQGSAQPAQPAQPAQLCPLRRYIGLILSATNGCGDSADCLPTSLMLLRLLRLLRIFKVSTISKKVCIARGTCWLAYLLTCYYSRQGGPTLRGLGDTYRGVAPWHVDIAVEVLLLIHALTF